LWSDPLDRRLALAIIRDLVSSEKVLSGLLDRARQAGLHPKLASWIGTGSERQSFSAVDVEKLLGKKNVEELAREASAPEKDVVYRLSRIVPQIVGRVLPAGEVKSPDVERIASKQSAPTSSRARASTSPG
jgi:uncharacterized protein YidB (DUF937 family)